MVVRTVCNTAQQFQAEFVFLYHPEDYVEDVGNDETAGRSGSRREK